MSTGTLETPRTRAGERAAATSRRAGVRPTAASTAPAQESPGGTAPFVLLIMVLLTAGLVTTLWLSTAAAADSYRLDSARQVARDLSEQSERLHRDVEAAQSAPALAAAARGQGMVPAGDPAVLLVAPDGSSRVIGDPRPAQAPVVPAVPATPVPAGQAATPATPATPGSPTAPTPDVQGAQAGDNGAQAPAPAGAAAAEDQLTAVSAPGAGG